MDYYIDTTPLINSVNWANVAPFQPSSFQESSPQRKVLSEQTEFVTAGASLIDFFAETKRLSVHTPPPGAESTPTLAESLSPHTATAAAPQLNAEIDQIAKQRVRLMAAKYASGERSSEIMARLEILNSRLSERAPLVSKEQVEALEDAYEQLDGIRAVREERAKRFGIPAKP
ncbi:hypothetical protein [Methyloterricola oryzae]|uniref:hypothetical protein n=1 Tax=Methyloterricola oryzae TaxID=1495050 RepID=UPI0011AEDCEC|nr:hypothetical protein [Methyloterricola oryzae]